MNITIDETIFKDRINEFVVSKFDAILDDSFKKKDWNTSKNGFGYEQLTNIITTYIYSTEFKQLTNKYISDNIEVLIKDIINNEIKRQTKDTIKSLINQALLNIKE
jgi:lysozyme family protein